MEKSIESIWKQGFINSDALVAPKLNNLYHQKSTHLVDKFKRMFKINLIAIVVGSILFLGISFLIGIPWMGIGFFLTLSVIVLVNQRLSAGLSKIDKSESSYLYIKAFDNWMKQQVSVNSKMARFYYPSFFLSMLLGFWQPLGEAFTNTLPTNYPGSYLIFGMPLFVILGIVLLIVLLSYFGASIYRWDLKVVYGGVLSKLDELTADMEELRK